MHNKTRINCALLLMVYLLISACGSGTATNTAADSQAGATAVSSPAAADVSAAAESATPSAVPAAPLSGGSLVASELISTPLAKDVTATFTWIGIPAPATSYRVACYKLTYTTPDTSNALVNASGLVCLPQGKTSPSALLSYQHGTISHGLEAPTSVISENFWVSAATASLGYVTLAPDYLGYGDSKTTLHPYLHAKTLSAAVVNLLRAAKLFMALPEIHTTTNGQLFLAGYSEGGYATLAAQKRIELELASEFTVTASEPGAGPYDMTGTVQKQLAAANLSAPAAAAFLATSYDMIYNTPSRISYYFTAAHADQMATLFSGRYNDSAINTLLGVTSSSPSISTNSLFNQAFLDSFNGSGETALKSAIADNNLYNWKPTAPTILFHGLSDDTVPYTNTTTALLAMQANGAANVTVHSCNAGSLPTTHANCGLPYLVDMMNTFSTITSDPYLIAIPRR